MRYFMKKGSLYYIKFHASEDEVPGVDAIFRCVSANEGNIDLEGIDDGRIIKCSDYADCEDFLNDSECMVTVKTLTKINNPEYFL